MIRQPSARATCSRAASGLTATGCPTARSMGRSETGVRVGVGGRRGRCPRARPPGDLLGLALAVDEGPVGAPGVDAVAGLRARADAAVEPEHVGQHLGELVRGGGDDVDRPPGVLVLVGGLQDLAGRGAAGSPPSASGPSRARSTTRWPAMAARIRSRTAWSCSSVEPRDPVADVGPGVLGEAAARDHTAPVGRAPEVDRARALDQRLVEVEEGGSAHAPPQTPRVVARYPPFTSRMIASPCPPPEQMAATPSPPPRRRSSCTSVPTMRAPEAPIGWPRAIAPPLTLTLSSAHAEHPHRVQRDRGERLVDLEQVDVLDREAGLLERRLGRVGRRPGQVGEVVGDRAGGDDLGQDLLAVLRAPIPRRRARRAAPPSLTPGELPAVWVPPSDSGGSFAMRSSEASERGPSSTAISTSPFFLS